jgi:hypothetical protein
MQARRSCGSGNRILMLMKAKSAMPGRPEARSYDEKSRHRSAEMEIADVFEKMSRAKSVEEVEVVTKGEVKD